MTTNDDQYVPGWSYDTEAGAGYLRLRKGKVRGSEAAGEFGVVDFGQDDETLGVEILLSADAVLIDAFLARVRREAAREALDGYAAQFDASAAAHGRDGLRICQINAESDAWRVRRYRDTHYPEETP